ncbi:hypothetical protein N658DRAFT_185291 [Parathielavia hyrcaniae]|uniref:Uncharacterized protein n=1 Tax=Parathielavia hyrcaniae TaxID=113614 RepID=A0AAN6T4A8_9PEZI|nr:hypothetical protein N658DRAFT_185291 [Parathielavia hyrcaniae]
MMPAIGRDPPSETGARTPGPRFHWAGTGAGLNGMSTGRSSRTTAPFRKGTSISGAYSGNERGSHGPAIPDEPSTLYCMRTIVYTSTNRESTPPHRPQNRSLSRRR